MSTATAMLAEARKHLGVSGRPNALTRAYASRHGSYFATAPWCDISVTEWARRSDNENAVLPAGDRAFTVWHAQDFKKAGRWHTGTVAELNDAQPGDIVFFDWGQSNNISAIDHVGIIEKALGGGRVQTIEGNTSDSCLRRVRSAAVIAGYGRPAYDKPKPAPLAAPDGTPVLQEGSSGARVEMLQRCLNSPKVIGAKLRVDGEFGSLTEIAVRKFQGKAKTKVDGEYGEKSEAALQKML